MVMTNSSSNSKSTTELKNGDNEVCAISAISSAEKALIRKVDLSLLPMLFFMFLANHLDRSNIGNAKVAGMEEDLRLKGQDYPWVLSLFFIGYVLGEVPSNMILSRSRPSIYLPTLMLCWGALCVIIAFSNSYTTLLALRFILGLVESGFYPGALFFLSTWYRRCEVARRFALFYSASVISGAFGGLLAGAITSKLHDVHGIAGWRYLFIIEGSGTVFLALVAYIVLPNFPSMPSRFFSTEERNVVILRLQQDGIDSYTRLTHWQAFVAALVDWRTYAFAALYMLNVSTATISYFIPTLLESLGYEGSEDQFLTAPIYAVAAVAAILISIVADRFEHHRHYHIAGLLLLGFAGTVAAALVTLPRAKYAMICVTGIGLWSTPPLVLSWTSNTVERPCEKRAVVIAIVNSVGALSNLYGSRIWPPRSAPEYTLGFGVTAGFLAAGSVWALGLGVALTRQKGAGRG